MEDKRASECVAEESGLLLDLGWWEAHSFTCAITGSLMFMCYPGCCESAFISDQERMTLKPTVYFHVITLTLDYCLVGADGQGRVLTSSGKKLSSAVKFVL